MQTLKELICFFAEHVWEDKLIGATMYEVCKRCGEKRRKWKMARVNFDELLGEV
jgi:hypothetical protein